MRVIHFDIPAEDPARAQSFYGSVFGWQFDRFPHEVPYFFVRTGDRDQPGIDGGLMQRMDPQQPVTCTIQVASVDAACRAIEDAGGAVVVPKFEVPGVGYKAFFTDTEGNVFGVAQFGA